MCYKENYEPPKMDENGRLEVESIILQGSPNIEATAVGQEFEEVNTYTEDGWIN